MFRINLNLFIFVLLIALLAGCTTKDGDVINSNPEFGNLLVTSDNFNGARIFINYVDSGKKTPALIENLPVGKHVVHLFLENSKSSPDSAIAVIEQQKETNLRFELTKVPSGDLNIITQPNSASVILNGLHFGLTPLRIIGIPAGAHNLSIQKSSYKKSHELVNLNAGSLKNIERNLNLQRIILLEHLSNTNCPPCPQADELAEKVLHDYGSAVAVGLGYHAYWPSRQDPMYLSGKEGNDARISYYLPTKIPTAWVNGKEVFNALDEANYRSLIDAELNKQPVVILEFQQISRTNESIQGQLIIKALEDLPEESLLYITLIQDEIDYIDAPGTNGQTYFATVFRQFSGDPEGDPVELDQNQRTTVPFFFEFENDWDTNVSVLAFVQHKSTKEVLQAGWTRFPKL